MWVNVPLVLLRLVGKQLGTDDCCNTDIDAFTSQLVEYANQIHCRAGTLNPDGSHGWQIRIVVTNKIDSFGGGLEVCICESISVRN